MTNRKLLLSLAGVGILAMFWKEFPAMMRYIKMERM
jgi:hypothetical protein